MFLSVSLAARGLNLELLPCTVTGSWIDLDLRLKLNLIKFTQFAQVTFVLHQKVLKFIQTWYLALGELLSHELAWLVVG